MLTPWKKSYNKWRQHIKKQRHHFSETGLYSQSYDFSSSHVWMWELDHKEGWEPKNFCIVVLENSWNSLGHQGDQISQSSWKSSLNIHWKDWCWSWSSNTLATSNTLAKSQLFGKDPDAGKDWRQEETTEDEMVGWHYWLNAQVWANSGRQRRTGKPGVLQSKGSESDTNEWLNNRWETLLSQLWSREIVCFNLNLRSLVSWL